MDEWIFFLVVSWREKRMLFVVENRSVVIEKLGSEAQKSSYLWLRLISIHPIEQERKAAAEGDCARYLLHLFHVFRFDPLFILLSSYASLHCSLLVAGFFSTPSRSLRGAAASTTVEGDRWARQQCMVMIRLRDEMYHYLSRKIGKILDSDEADTRMDIVKRFGFQRSSESVREERTRGTVVKAHEEENEEAEEEERGE